MSTVKTFETWRQAYDYQQSNRVSYEIDENDGKYFLDIDYNYPSDLNGIIGSTDDDIVWMVGISSDENTYPTIHTQYGVTSTQKWCTINFWEDENGEIVCNEVSLKFFSQLPHLVSYDPRAVSIYENINHIFDIYKFMENGRIEEEDVVKPHYLENAKRVREYAKAFDKNNSKEQKVQDEYTNDSEKDLESNKIEEECSCGMTLGYCNDDVCTENEEDDFDKEEDEDEFSTLYNQEDEEEEEIDNTYYLEEEEKTYVYLFKFSETREGSKQEEMRELTEEQAQEHFEDLTWSFKYVEMLKLVKVSVDFT